MLSSTGLSFISLLHKTGMNDPCGLLYHNGAYHLFFQYNPGAIQWGNMSWGHATSTDLTYWEQHPLAFLARGFISNVTEMYFTGSTVADVNNTSGFGTDGTPPLVTMHTSYVTPSDEAHLILILKTTDNVFSTLKPRLCQAESVFMHCNNRSPLSTTWIRMAWTTYDAKNPVIQHPPAPHQSQYENFQDPHVFWHEQTWKRIVVTTLAELHKLLMWTSHDLKD